MNRNTQSREPHPNPHSDNKEELFEYYLWPFYRYLLKIALASTYGDQDAAHDVVTEVLLKYYSTRDYPTELNQLKASLRVALRNKLIDRSRSQTNKPTTHVNHDAVAIEAWVEDTAMVCQRRELQRVSELTNELERDISIMRVHGFTYKRIAQTLLISDKTARTIFENVTGN